MIAIVAFVVEELHLEDETGRGHALRRCLRQRIVKGNGGQQSAPVEMRSGGSEILHRDVVFKNIGTKYEDGVGLRMLEAIVGVRLRLREVEVKK
jgi:hypothetical protein